MKTLLALMAGTLAFSACSDEDALLNENTGNATDATPILSFNAATESDGATRAAIDGFDIKWQENDAILMFDGTRSSKYNLATGAATTSGTFTVDGGSTAVSGENIYALYPYAESSSRTVSQAEAEAAAGDASSHLDMWKSGYENAEDWEKDSYFESPQITDALEMAGVSEENKAIVYAYIKGEEIGTPAPALSGTSITNVVIPDVQTVAVAAGQTVDPKAVLMVAKADGEDLAFKNVCSYVMVTPTVACKKIVVRAEGAKLAGTCTVAVSDEPAATITSDGKSVVTLKAADGDLAAGTYYIAVLPGTKNNGIEVRFYTSDDTFNHNVRTTPFEFVRNKVHNGGNNSGAAAVYWSLNTGNYGWADGSASAARAAKTITFLTGVTDPRPDGAIALNNDNTLWSRKDAENNYFIETPASKIYAKSLDGTFFEAENVTTMTGLDLIDVSESSSFNSCFDMNHSILSLDLSTWKINPNASTEYMIGRCTSLTSLTLNNTFHSGDNMFEATASSSGNCIVYGVTDEAVKNDLNGSDWTDTNWNASNMHFYGE